MPVYENDSIDDEKWNRRERQRASSMSWTDQYITHPRARACVQSIQLGAKMGASVGGCFGLLTGIVVAVTQRNLLVLPVSVIGGSISFGFFLGCGMIIRCEDRPGGPRALTQGGGGGGCALSGPGGSLLKVSHVLPSLQHRRAPAWSTIEVE